MSADHKAAKRSAEFNFANWRNTEERNSALAYRERDAEVVELRQQLEEWERFATECGWNSFSSRPAHLFVQDKLYAERKARKTAEQNIICDVCLGKPLPSGKNCVCKGTGNLIYTLQGTRENMANEWQRAETAELESASLRHDIARQVQIAAKLATECEALRKK